MLTLSRNKAGFTIVELLIVIVVIGILAAITIVSYNGIVNRAKDTQNQVDAATIGKVATAMYAVDTGYPTGTTDATLTASFATATTVKLPSDVTVKVDTLTTSYGPSYNTLKSNAESNPRAYFVRVCTDGLVVFYPKRSGTSASTSEGRVIVGAGCPPLPTTPN